MTKEKLGMLISKLRKQKDLTQDDLARLTNLNIRSIQRIEAGEVMPRLYTLKVLSKYLDYNLLPFKKKPLLLYTGMAVLLVAGISIIGYMFLNKSKYTIESIAILPLINNLDDSNNKNTTDEIQKVLIQKLTKIADLKVISQDSVIQFKDSGKSVKDLSNELDVSAVLRVSLKSLENDQIQISWSVFHRGLDGILLAQMFKWSSWQLEIMPEAFGGEIARKLSSVI